MWPARLHKRRWMCWILVAKITNIGIGLLLLLGFFSPERQADAQTTVSVAVSILPQKYFVEKIGGERVRATVMVLPGENPATYEPRPSQLVAISRSKTYFAIGVPFERVWLEKFTRINPKIQIVSTERGIEKHAMDTYEDVFSDQGPPWMRRSGLKKSEREMFMDPHVWLSPPFAMIIARNMLMALCYLDREHRDEYEENFKKFQMDIITLDRELRDIFSGIGEKNRFMVFHPAWGYFADAYGLRQIPVEIEGKEPKPAQLQAIIQYAKRLGIKKIFAQPQFSTRSLHTIARAVGAEVSFADPLAIEWAGNLKDLALEIRPALR
ncbi:MAG: zinc ABC transporter substrate-binding protein [Deltaproteobacteria bacterium]|nr:zinc ABC transporter substrate-binding protein [Deltaproteobacteria bacterium]